MWRRTLSRCRLPEPVARELDDTPAKPPAQHIVDLQHALGNRAVQRLVEDALSSPSEPLSDSSRERMENTFGRDFTNVRIHADAKSARAAGALETRGFAFGNDIVLGEQPDTDTFEGRKLLAHELTHVVQQENSAPAVFQALSEVPAAAESEAETIASMAAAGTSVEPRVATSIMLAKAGHVEVAWLRRFDEILLAEQFNRRRFEGALRQMAKTVQRGAKRSYADTFEHTVHAAVFSELHRESPVSTLRSIGRFDLEGIGNLVRMAGLLHHHWFTPMQEADWLQRLEGSFVHHAVWFDGLNVSWVDQA